MYMYVLFIHVDVYIVHKNIILYMYSRKLSRVKNIREIVQKFAKTFVDCQSEICYMTVPAENLQKNFHRRW